ncbi:MAG TPA: hypothetical protein ENI82_05110, partial [Bacteroidetes bacterium]|nr:hypothetical protein [Bacteroidota bacterium]
VPRMTEVQRNNIASPATGLLVYQNDGDMGFWYFDGTDWIRITTKDPIFERNGTTIRQTANYDTDDFIFGSNSLPQNGVPITDTLFFFDKSKAAFRIGKLNNSANWAPDSIGWASFATGANSKASGNFSIAMGANTIASGNRSVSLGNQTTASGDKSTAMGNQTTASGDYSTAMGDQTEASGNNSTAMGYQTEASSSYSTAMGYQTTASGYYSTAMGKNSEASGHSSTASGFYATASGYDCIAMGNQTTASGDYSTAMGNNTTALSGYETALGRYNDSYTPNSTTDWNDDDRLFVIGNGSSSTNKHNALTILKNGKIGIGISSPDPSSILDITSTDKGILVPRMTSAQRIAITSPATGLLIYQTNNNTGFWYFDGTDWIRITTKDQIFERNGTTIRQTANYDTDDFIFGKNSLPQNGVPVTDTLFFFDKSKAAFRIGKLNNSANWAPDSIGWASFATGENSKASGNFSVAMGDNSTASGNRSIAIGEYTTASGSVATAMGEETTASAIRSTAMGYQTKASGNISTAMGINTKASGVGSTVMGSNTKASGNYATAMGFYTTASGYKSTAIGGYTTAPSGYETSIGRYNDSYTPNSTTDWDNDDRLFVIGNGSSSTNRHNALTILKNGKIGIGISSPDPSSILDITSTGKGILVPRMTSAQRDAITSPATGLLIYQTNNNKGFWYFDGTSWLSLNDSEYVSDIISDADNDTKIQVEETADDDIIRFDAAGTEIYRFVNGRIIPQNTGNSIFIGADAGLNDDFTDNRNVGLGYQALKTNTIGTRNVGIGYLALDANVKGNRNTAIGFKADVTSDSLINATAIGANAVVSADSCLVLGNAAKVGIGISNPTYALQLPNDSDIAKGSGRAYAWTTYSDSRVKFSQKPLDYSINEIMKLTPKSYIHHSSTFENGKLSIKDEGEKTIGLIAQEVYKIIPEAAQKPDDENKELWSMDYEKLIPVLIKGMQQQQKKIEDQQKANQEQKEKIDALTKQNEEILKRLDELEGK